MGFVIPFVKIRVSRRRAFVSGGAMMTRRVGGAADATPGEAEARRGHGGAKSPSGDSSPRRIRGSAAGTREQTLTAIWHATTQYRRNYERGISLASINIGRNSFFSLAEVAKSGFSVLCPYFGNHNTNAGIYGTMKMFN